LLSLIRQSRNLPLHSFTSSYKNFKDGFLKVLFEAEGRTYVYNGDVPKFPLHWTKSPTRYQAWPRSSMPEEDLAAISVLDRLPHDISTRGLIDTFWCDHPSNNVLDMFFA